MLTRFHSESIIRQRPGGYGNGGANLTGEDLGVRVTRRAQKTQPDQVGLLSANLVNNDLIRCLRIGLIKYHALVPGALTTAESDMIPIGGKPITRILPFFARVAAGRA